MGVVGCEVNVSGGGDEDGLVVHGGWARHRSQLPRDGLGRGSGLVRPLRRRRWPRAGQGLLRVADQISQGLGAPQVRHVEAGRLHWRRKRVSKRGSQGRLCGLSVGSRRIEHGPRHPRRPLALVLPAIPAHQRRRQPVLGILRHLRPRPRLLRPLYRRPTPAQSCKFRQRPGAGAGLHLVSEVVNDFRGGLADLDVGHLKDHNHRAPAQCHHNNTVLVNTASHCYRPHELGF
mmetsp:Transcript_134095/g.304052  ORF Transcript_134095/g.304052 Transcript_134095/m.304052 type:complete len:232 (+) Transcript_134095:651-1346(+)